MLSIEVFDYEDQLRAQQAVDIFRAAFPLHPEVDIEFSDSISKAGQLGFLALVSSESAKTVHPVGAATVSVDNPPYINTGTARLEYIGVLPNIRNHHIGKLLLNSIIYNVRKRGKIQLSLQAGRSDKTRRFYQNNGFVMRNPITSEMYRQL